MADQGVSVPGITMADVQAVVPQPATSAPPAVQASSDKGSGARYALENHTHESRLQARRIQLTFDSNGEALYVFPIPYASGIVPILEATAENTRGSSYYYDASILQGSTTNTQTTLCIRKTPRTITVSILGAVVNLFTNPADTVWINILSRAPS